MDNLELTSLTLAKAVELIRRREISPVELTRAYLERINTLDIKLNSFITVTAETAIQRAKQAEKELQQGKTADNKPLGRLHGIPITLKDLIETQQVLTTAGSLFYSSYIPKSDAFVVDKLKAAGAIFLGKTNMHEIALGLTNVNPHYGSCRNPWAIDCVPGGSSGGSAVALSAGLCLGSLGSDTGGSIRVPAALCGIVGLKPTYGRVSMRGVIPLSWNLDHVGPMARRVKDVAILLQEIAGYDPYDPYSINVPVDDYLARIGDGIRDWRVALASDDFFDQVDPDIHQAVQAAAEVFNDLGGRVSQSSFPGAYEAALANGQMTISDAAAFHHKRILNSAQDFGVDVRERLQAGASLPLKEYILARRVQTKMRWQFQNFFKEFEILLTPTTAIPAPPIEGLNAVSQARRLTRFTAPFNLTGLPAISIPCGFTTKGLPIGLQIVAAPWAEAQALQVAYAYERATEWHKRVPIQG